MLILNHEIMSRGIKVVICYKLKMVNIMSNESENLYTIIVYNLLNSLKGEFQFAKNNIDYGNVEFVPISSNIGGISVNDFSIEFQKQNSSFTVLINKNLQETVEQKLIHLIEEAVGIPLFASYRFTDMKNITIKHWCYSEEKIEFNKNILNSFKRMNGIEDLKYFTQKQYNNCKNHTSH